MSGDTRKDLKSVMWEAAQLYAALNTDKPEVGIYTAWDGLRIPPSTRVRVVIELIHNDTDFTPELSAAELAEA